MRGTSAAAGAALVIADAFLKGPVGRQLRRTSGGDTGGDTGGSGGLGNVSVDDTYALMFDDDPVGGQNIAGGAAVGILSGGDEGDDDEVFKAGSAEALARDAVARRVAAQVEADKEEAKRMYFQGTSAYTLVRIASVLLLTILVLV